MRRRIEIIDYLLKLLITWCLVGSMGVVIPTVSELLVGKSL